MLPPLFPLPAAAAAADQCDGLDGRRELFVAQTILSCGDGRQHAGFSSFPIPCLFSSLSPSPHGVILDPDLVPDSTQTPDLLASSSRLLDI